MNASGYRVLCLTGSLRSASSNTAALRAACRIAPPGLHLECYEGLHALPPFNPDVETAILPRPVLDLRRAVGAADALLVACPEYAHGIPGVFKNLLDWLVGSLEFPGKPVLQLNVSGRFPHHAQDALTEVLRTMNARPVAVPPPVVALPGSGCSVDSVLGDRERRGELSAALELLHGALAAGSAAAGDA